MYSIQPHSTVLVLNSSYEPLHFTNWKRAIILLFKEKAKVISSSVIRLVNYVIIPFRRMTNMYPTRNLIYKRDKNKCQYCGSTKSLTIDHVIPKSKGGEDTWENLVVACSSCNVKKGDKLLEQTNMKLARTPRAPVSKVLMDLENSNREEWKEFSYSDT
jgi:5-methylcytosine-specific restriction endonuclease McrA|tara:strand:+ start:63 stop:539 length:477 start_codon:yes stop_codon:yes gene_type:complete